MILLRGVFFPHTRGMALVTLEVMDMEVCHIDFEQAYLFADMDSEICIVHPEEYREFPDAVGN